MDNFHSGLSDHKLKKGKFITPFNDGLGEMASFSSWSTDRLPEYLWLGFVLKHYGRKEGLLKCQQILHWLTREHKEISVPNWSEILELNSHSQCIFYDYVVTIIEPSILSPLTIIYHYSKHPEFSKYFFDSDLSVEERHEQLIGVLKDYYFQQSYGATDLKYLIIYFFIAKKNLVIGKSGIEASVLKYSSLEHSDQEMRIIRPTIRSLEIAFQSTLVINEAFTKLFWSEVSKMSDCELKAIKFPIEEYDAGNYMDSIQKAIRYLSELLKADNPLDNKMLVLLGIATYSYKCILEVVNHDLYNTIVARSSIRIVIENYIMMKYLIKNESSHKDIWTEYQYYGIGLYKLVLAKSRDTERNLLKSHVEYKYLDVLVNEYIMEEYIDMDTSYFDKQGIREKAISVDERELFGLFYDYDSSYAHGLWGAIRESSLLKCDSPAHQFHCVPDYENSQNLKSVWHDCVYVMNNTIHLISNIYPLPQELLDEVDSYAQ